MVAYTLLAVEEGEGAFVHMDRVMCLLFDDPALTHRQDPQDTNVTVVKRQMMCL